MTAIRDQLRTIFASLHLVCGIDGQTIIVYVKEALQWTCNYIDTIIFSKKIKNNESNYSMCVVARIKALSNCDYNSSYYMLITHTARATTFSNQSCQKKLGIVNSAMISEGSQDSDNNHPPSLVFNPSSNNNNNINNILQLADAAMVISTKSASLLFISKDCVNSSNNLVRDRHFLNAASHSFGAEFATHTSITW